MAIPSPGEIKNNFNRTYIVVNPDATKGPPTYRLSSPDEIAHDAANDLNGVDPIIVTADSVTKETQISMDISKLDDRNT
jgi:hypothetical protein